MFVVDLLKGFFVSYSDDHGERREDADAVARMGEKGKTINLMGNHPGTVEIASGMSIDYSGTS